MAKSAGFDLDAYLPAAGLGRGPLYQFEIASGLAYLDCFHEISSFVDRIRECQALTLGRRMTAR
jgi:hypothetical protein